VGDASVVVDSVVVDSVVLPSEAAGVIVAIGVDSAGLVDAGGFTTVVLFSVVLSAGEAAGATVSVFCSHATRSAAPARMQIYFFIGNG
jgi:hypothetical protein